MTLITYGVPILSILLFFAIIVGIFSKSFNSEKMGLAPNVLNFFGLADGFILLGWTVVLFGVHTQASWTVMLAVFITGMFLFDHVVSIPIYKNTGEKFVKYALLVITALQLTFCLTIGYLHSNISQQSANVPHVLSGKVQELGYVVSDMDEAIHYWVDIMGAGPFFKTEVKPLNPKFYGKAIVHESDVEVAFGAFGGQVIELIKVNSGDPLVWGGKNHPLGGTFNHWTILTKNYDADVAKLEKLGIKQAFYAELGVSNIAINRMVYMDTFEKSGGYLEFIEINPPLISEMYKHVLSAAVNWDGSDPIRKM